MGDEQLPSYLGIISQTMKFGSLLNNQYFMESRREYLYPIESMGLVYLPTFTIKINHSCR